MKTILMFFLVVAVIGSTACKKDDVKINDEFDASGYTLLQTKSFISDDHPTSGQLQVYGKGDTLAFVFKNFKTDDGPNLDVWLTNNLPDPTMDYLELGDLKSIEGNFYYKKELTEDFAFLVIWCTDFSVPFGHVEFDL